MFTPTVHPAASASNRATPVSIWTRGQCMKYLHEHGIAFDDAIDVTELRKLVEHDCKQRNSTNGDTEMVATSMIDGNTGSSSSVVRKRIKTQEDLKMFLTSRTFAEIWAFILKINIAVKDLRMTSVPSEKATPVLQSLVKILEKLEDIIDTIPPIEQSTRYGNKAFRIFHQRLVQVAPELIEELLIREEDKKYRDELAAYFAASFGNETRIDYGSGHEAQFLVFLYCLEKIDIVDEDDHQGLGLIVFPAYLKVTRKLQMIYRLEPAGSRGVWGLDDYSFLPFLWGSAQLVSNERVSPTIIDDRALVDEYADDFLYFGALKFIHGVKTGASFAEHSPLLTDISHVSGGWTKINQGMCKMYRAEVWEKRPVMQHLLFGNIVKFEDEKETERYQKRILE